MPKPTALPFFKDSRLTAVRDKPDATFHQFAPQVCCPIQAEFRKTVPIKVNANFAPKVSRRRLHAPKLRVSIKGDRKQAKVRGCKCLKPTFSSQLQAWDFKRP